MAQTQPLNGAIVSFINYGSGTAIDLTSGNKTNGTPLQGFKFHGGKNQQWKLELVDAGPVWPTWKLQNVQSGTYADLKSGDSTNGTPVLGYEKLNNNNQLWRLVTADPSGQVVQIQNVGTGTFMDLYNGSAADSTKITGWVGNLDNKNSHQIWRIQRV